MLKIKFTLVSLLLLAITGLQGCSEDKPSDSAAVDSTFTGLYNNLFSQDCADCHRGSASDPLAGELDFRTASDAYVTLTTLGATGTGSAGACSGVSIVASTVSQSYLMAVLFEDYNSDIGGCTPIDDHVNSANISSLADLYKSALITWINNGAPND